jgi:hypothetical protein
MSRGAAAKLAEALDFLQGQVVAAQVEQAIEQHRAVPGGQDEAVAAEPAGVGRIVAHEAGEQQVAERGGAHRHPGMPRVGFLHRVDRQYADRVDAKLVEIGLRQLSRSNVGRECHQFLLPIA